MKWVRQVLLYLLIAISLPLTAQVIQGERSPGSYRPILVNPYGHLLPSDYLASVGFGEVGSIRRVVGLGANLDIDTGTIPEDVWSGGGLYPWMTGLTSLELVSSSANDAAAGTGARTVLVQCLNDAYAELTITVTPNGLTPVALTSQCFRINGAFITSAGSGQTNAGDLTIRDAGAGTTRAVIPTGYGTAQQSNYTVPAGYTLQVTSIFMAVTRSTGTPAYADFVTYMKFPNSGNFYRMPITLAVSNSAPYRHDSLPGIVLAEKTDFLLRVTSVSASNTSVSGSWLGIMRATPVN